MLLITCLHVLLMVMQIDDDAAAAEREQAAASPHSYSSSSSTAAAGSHLDDAFRAAALAEARGDDLHSEDEEGDYELGCEVDDGLLFSSVAGDAADGEWQPLSFKYNKK
jgi:hypothetical protein